MTIILVFLLFFLLIIIGMPILSAMGIVTISIFSEQSSVLVMLAQKMFSSIDNFTYLSIPLFILASELMTRCDLMEDLVDFCDAMIGRVRGGLALVNILGSMLFAGVSGSASADTTGLGRVEIETMSRAGYDRTYSTTVTVASSIIGPIIPPSNCFIIYAACAGQISVAGMFMAGVLPGILLGLVEMIICYIYAVKNNHPVSRKRTLREKGKATLHALPILMLPLIILGGIVSGIFTATESAAIAVIYAIIIAAIRKKLTLKVLYECCCSCAKSTAGVMFIIAVASLMGYAITVMRLPQITIEWVTSMISNKYLFLLFVNVLLLLLGCVLDQTPAMLLAVPILLPIARNYGINPIHFGLICCFNLTVGLITPPVGMQLFIGANVGSVKLSDLYRTILPFAVVGIIVLLLITYIPWFTTALPALFGYI